MSEQTQTIKKTSLPANLAEWLVVLVTVAALLLGWVLMTSVQNRSVPFTGEGISAETPTGWLSAKAEGSEVLRVSDPTSGGFATTYLVETFPVAKDSTASQAATFLGLQHSQSLDGYRVLDQNLVTVLGQQAYELKYVYVASNPNLTHDIYPAVVLGVDYIFIKDGRAVVASYWAEKDAYQAGLGRFQRFLGSLKY